MTDMFRLYCANCGFNAYTDGSDIDKYQEYKRSPLMKTPPVLDKKTNKTTPAVYAKLPKKYKCSCGHLMSPKKVKFNEEEQKETQK